uniref:(northern house mosquito) hypothetical protein n=1 Tax=Culex pipiens TaxID=7175 RepID=A0A8D8BTE8_CULPI
MTTSGVAFSTTTTASSLAFSCCCARISHPLIHCCCRNYRCHSSPSCCWTSLLACYSQLVPQPQTCPQLFLPFAEPPPRPPEQPRCLWTRRPVRVTSGTVTEFGTDFCCISPE